MRAVVLDKENEAVGTGELCRGFLSGRDNSGQWQVLGSHCRAYREAVGRGHVKGKRQAKRKMGSGKMTEWGC